MLRRTLVNPRWLGLALMVVLLGGCDREDLTGSYQATVFTYQPAGGAVTDVLAAGGNITLTIHNDRSTSGTMLIPGSVVQGSNQSVSLLGQAVELEGVVTLSLSSDTFLRDMEFTFDGNSLSGSDTFSGVSVVVVLTK